MLLTTCIRTCCIYITFGLLTGFNWDSIPITTHSILLQHGQSLLTGPCQWNISLSNSQPLLHSRLYKSAIDPLQLTCYHSNICHLKVQPIFTTLITFQFFCVSIRVKQYQEVEWLLLHSMAVAGQVRPMLFPMLPKGYFGSIQQYEILSRQVLFIPLLVIRSTLQVKTLSKRISINQPSHVKNIVISLVQSQVARPTLTQSLLIDNYKLSQLPGAHRDEGTCNSVNGIIQTWCCNLFIAI